jgi:hypothetical protein
MDESAVRRQQAYEEGRRFGASLENVYALSTTFLWTVFVVGLVATGALARGLTIGLFLFALAGLVLSYPLGWIVYSAFVRNSIAAVGSGNEVRHLVVRTLVMLAAPLAMVLGVFLLAYDALFISRGPGVPPIAFAAILLGSAWTTFWLARLVGRIIAAILPRGMWLADLCTWSTRGYTVLSFWSYAYLISVAAALATTGDPQVIERTAWLASLLGWPTAIVAFARGLGTPSFNDYVRALGMAYALERERQQREGDSGD